MLEKSPAKNNVATACFVLASINKSFCSAHGKFIKVISKLTTSHRRLGSRVLEKCPQEDHWLREYASLVLDNLDVKLVFLHHLFRHPCREIDGKFVKDLENWGTDWKSVVILHLKLCKEEAPASIVAVLAKQGLMVWFNLFVDIVNNSLRNQFVLSVKLQRISGSVSSVDLLVVGEGRKGTQEDIGRRHNTVIPLSWRHNVDGCGSCDCSWDSATSETLLNSKVEAIVNEYNDLLTTQLENQKLYFESLLLEAKEETEREISEAVQKALNLKLQKLQAKLDKYFVNPFSGLLPDWHFFGALRVTPNSFLHLQINDNLLKNQEIWKAKIEELEERVKHELSLKDEKIKELEDQLRELMMHFESGYTVEQLPKSSESKDVCKFIKE
ncbi:FCP1 homology domain [Dillenia turbinata]|uniref:FCP1 homology domain n=1 Tax=Dillenia turbinata TaxID=194707 RepID=A0AAN8ZJZ5_9MAGN